MQTNHLPQDQITFANQGMTRESARDLTFTRDGQQIYVADYYQQNYNMNLQFPRLNCIIQRKPQGESFYPMELLNVV